MNRREVLRTAALTLGVLSAAGAGTRTVGRARARQAELDVTASPRVAPVTVQVSPNVRLHGVQSGWIAVKEAHVRLRGPSALRLPAIVAGTRWAAPIPILSWIVEHPEGVVVVDAGERADARDLDAYTRHADPGNRFIIRGNFRVNVHPDDELGPQLRRLGLSRRDVRHVVQTHLHFDHAGGLTHVPRAEVLVAREELDGQRALPVGALRSVWPPELEPRPVDVRPADTPGFAREHVLTRAGDVVIVPTPGHSYGHQSVIVHGDDRAYLLAGDVTFDEAQLLRRELAGIVHDVARAADSLERTRAFVRSTPTVFLPSHDASSLARLAARQITTVPDAG
ncbi:N-acyl homoserine lactonase family protein [Deinococcus pimensis]|uniref:N-acyl homoserine lactonase family protein n=1 Tax=Deinococcus pimensis TaxID=309888 RepID=UPI00069452C5|nr:N-acyl homoserine lactonase family protein [Deinococcus pimensis]